MLPHWRRLTLPELALFWIAIWVALFAAWNRPLYVDLAAGNVTVFEQLLVWLGLLAFARGRPVLFAFGIGVAASMRLMPLALLVLLVFTWRRSPRSALIAGGTALVVFLLPHLASLVFDRSEYLGYLGVVGRMSEEARGETNPSSYALLRDVVEHASRQAMTGGWLALHARAVAFLLWLALASGGLCFYLISSWKLHLDRRPLLLLSYTCFCLACLLPRFKMYSYLLVVAPTVYTLQALPVAARALLLAAAVWGLPFTGFFQSGYLAYFPLWLFAATLFLICGPLARRQKNAGFFADAAL
jgi:hypothetical protein